VRRLARHLFTLCSTVSLGLCIAMRTAGGTGSCAANASCVELAVME
jgi:hypothetical protein